MKRKISLILAVLLCVTTLSACSLSDDNLPARTETSQNATSEATTSADTTSADTALAEVTTADVTTADVTTADTTAVDINETTSSDVIQETSPETIDEAEPEENTPFSRHGALRVDGTDLVDSSGSKYQLYGMSTHGIAWFPQFVNLEAFKTLRDDWNTNCVRLAMYTYENNGYCSDGDKETIKALVKNGVDYATQLGMYVIIDWHVLNDRDPNKYKDEALAFFEEMSKLYADYDNVIYEICNEPNGSVSWDDIKSYANAVIPTIRANDSNAVILVGTPTWSQNIDQAMNSPLDYDNIMYTLHFYAATHTDWLRQRAQSCIDGGLPIFISEFGICDASGNGGNDFGQANEWKSLIEGNNISFFCWNLANKDESSSVIATNCNKTSDWEDGDLKESGQWIKKWFTSEANQ